MLFWMVSGELIIDINVHLLKTVPFIAYEPVPKDY